eukprot:1903659-Lingulodinium_polyedra.AAC.1
MAVLATAKSLGLQAFLSEGVCKELDASVDKLKEFSMQLIAVTNVLVSEKPDLKHADIVRFAKTIADWASMPSSCQNSAACGLVASGFRALLNQELAR